MGSKKAKPEKFAWPEGTTFLRPVYKPGTLLQFCSEEIFMI